MWATEPPIPPTNTHTHNRDRDLMWNLLGNVQYSFAVGIRGFKTVRLMKVGNGDILTEKDAAMWVLETTLGRIRVREGKNSLVNLNKCV